MLLTARRGANIISLPVMGKGQGGRTQKFHARFAMARGMSRLVQSREHDGTGLPLDSSVNE
jgi:hypothetical protein